MIPVIPGLPSGGPMDQVSGARRRFESITRLDPISFFLSIQKKGFMFRIPQIPNVSSLAIPPNHCVAPMKLLPFSLLR